MACVITIRNLGRKSPSITVAALKFLERHLCISVIGSSKNTANFYNKSSAICLNKIYLHLGQVGCIKNYSQNAGPDNAGPDNVKDTDRKKCDAKPTLFQRFKQMYRDYWYVLVPVHLVTSACWFGGFYCLAKSGVDIVAILEYLHFSERITNSLKDSSMGYIAIAYALYKIATPIRYGVTLGGTTISIQYLTKWGYIKPVPSREKLVKIYQETKEDLKERKENIMETVRETKADIKEKKDNLISTMRETKKGIQETVTKDGIKYRQDIIDDVKKKISTIKKPDKKT